MKVLAIICLVALSNSLLPFFDDVTDEIDEMIGMYKGMCKTEEYKCAHVFIDNKEKVVAAFQKAEKDIEEGKDPIEVAFELASFIRGLDGFIDQCRVFEMREVIEMLLNKEGFKTLLKNMIDNWDDIWEAGQKEEEARKAGKCEEQGKWGGVAFRLATGFWVY